MIDAVSNPLAMRIAHASVLSMFGEDLSANCPCPQDRQPRGLLLLMSSADMVGDLRKARSAHFAALQVRIKRPDRVAYPAALAETIQ
jgi:hypothetical protein